MIDIDNGTTSFRTACRWLRFCFVVCTLVTTPVFAAKHTFNPSIGAHVTYIDNVLFVDDPGQRPSDGDTSTRITLHLPYHIDTRLTALSLRYTTTFDSFRQFEELDFIGHKVTARLVVNRGPRSLLKFYGTLALSQDENFVAELQTDPDAPDLVDSVLLQRTERLGGNVRVIYRRMLTPRWTWSTNVSASKVTVDAIDDPGALSTANLEDKQAAGITLRLDRLLSPRTTIGGAYSYRIVDQEQSGDVDVQEMRFTLSQDVSKRVTLRAEAGAYQRTKENTANDGSLDTSGFSGSLDIGFNEDVTIGPFKLDFRLGARPATGGTLEGTSTNNTASVVLTDSRARNWMWSLFSRFANRVPFDRDLPTYNTFSTGISVEKDVGKELKLRGQAKYVTQSSSDTDESTGAFYRVSAGVTWHPFAGTRIAGE